jgi:hypothetical protein
MNYDYQKILINCIGFDKSERAAKYNQMYFNPIIINFHNNISTNI